MIHARRSTVLRTAMLCLLAVLGSVAAARASTFTVTRLDDPTPGTCLPGDCSLRSAIIAANQNPGPDVIVLAPGQTYVLTRGPADVQPTDLTPASGDLDVTDSLVINGNGSTVDASFLNDRVFHVQSPDPVAPIAVTFNDLTITGGVATGLLSLGGGLYVRDAVVTLNHCTVVANSTQAESGSRDDGGGIAVVGSYVAPETLLAHLTLDDTMVAGNTGSNGGGIVCVLCALTVGDNSVISGNTATGSDGGGITVVGDASTVLMTKSLVSDNVVSGPSPQGGALSAPAGVSVSTLAFNRIVSNTAGSTGGIFTLFGSVSAQNNWWGCNLGPGQGGPNCAAAANAASGSVTTSPFLVLAASASPAIITTGSHATATASLTTNSNNVDVSGLGSVPDTTIVSFAGGPGVLALPTGVMTGGKTTDDFTGTIGGAVNLNATLDGQTVPFSLIVNTPPTISAIGDQTTLEDTPAGPIPFIVGDVDGNPLTVTASALNPALVGSIVIGGSGNSRDVTVTPAPNVPVAALSASTVITITVNDGFTVTSTSFLFTVVAVNDAPTLDPIASPAPISEDSGQQVVNLSGIGAGGGESQALTVTATSDNHALIQDPTVTYTSANATGSLSYTPIAGAFGTATVAVTVRDDGGTANGGADTTIRTFVVTVSPVADTPSVTSAATVVNTQTTEGLVVSRNAADGPEVTHFKVIQTTGGTLFLNDGTTPVPDGTFITSAQGAAGLRFTPTHDSVTTGFVRVQASISNTDAGLGGGFGLGVVAISPLPSTTTVTTSGSPSNPGQTVTFTASITVAPALATATGNVVFSDNTVALGAPVAVSNGTASFSISSLAPGHHNISVFYSGNSLVVGSGGELAGGQDVRTGVTVDVVASSNPVLLGNAVTIQATPTHAGGGVATGTMTFKDGATTLATSTLSAGSGAFTSSVLSLGTHHVVADYTGDAAFAPASGSLDLVVSCPTMTIGPASIGPAVIGTPYTQTFTATGVGPGSVTFSLSGALPQGMSFDIPTATLSGSPSGPGSYSIQVTATRSNGCGAATASYTLLVGGGRAVLTGADAGGGPHVRRLLALDGSTPPTGALSSFFAFDPSFTGGVRVAEGDVNGDGQPDYIVGAGPGGAPEVRVYDGRTGALLGSFEAFEPEFAGGVTVAAGDVNGDGFVDMVVGSGPGRSGEVKVYSGLDGSLIRDVFVFDRGFTGGVRVAAGDVNGDGFADVIAGTGPGRADVTVLDGAGGTTLRTFSAYPSFGGGVFVAAGDVTGDGYADVITGAGEGGGPQVDVFDIHNGGTLVQAFFAFEPGFTGGARVAAGDVNGDGRAEIIVGSGPGRPAAVRVFDGATDAKLSDLQPYGAGFNAGLFVATTAPYAQMSIDSPTATPTHGTFMVSGWALEDGGPGTGVDGIDVVAIPVGGGPTVALGAATLGDPRPDVAAIYGPAYANVGFHLAVNGLPPGIYDLRVTARRAHVANLSRVIRITVTPVPTPIVSVDAPAAGRFMHGTFHVAGWALTPENPNPPGIDAIQVFATPLRPEAHPQFLGLATLGIARPDVAAIYGAQYLNSGFDFAVTGLTTGAWDLQIVPHATGAAYFAPPVMVRVTVLEGSSSSRLIVTGNDLGDAPIVAHLDPAVGIPLNKFYAFDPSYTGGVRVAEADINGDGLPETIVGPGPQSPPVVRIFDGATQSLRSSFMAFEPEFQGGVFVAAGDVNGDGVADIVVGSGPGRSGEVKVFDGRDLSLIRDMFVFDRGFTGGVRVAVGDLNGDGLADLIVGSGPGMPAEVRVFNAADGSVLRVVNPYGAFAGGVFVAAGDVTGDGYADIVTGAGEGGGPLVRVFDGITGSATLAFFAFEPAFTGGARVAVADIDGDGRADIIVGSGPGRNEIRSFDRDGQPHLLWDLGGASGLFVATAAPINRMTIDVPAAGATVHGPIPVSGWAFFENPVNTGIAAIHVWAFPVATGAPTFVGVATLGDPRPDVAAIYGAQYGHAGFHLSGAALPPGVYDIAVFGQNAATGSFAVIRVVRVTVTP